MNQEGTKGIVSRKGANDAEGNVSGSQINSWLVLIGLFVMGCGQKDSPPATIADKTPVDAWKLVCVDPFAKEPALLWNGLIGLRIGRDGTGHGLSSFDICEYEVEGEEKIKPLVSPFDGTLEINNQAVIIDASKPYLQELDMRSGLLSTSYTTTKGFSVTCELAIHPSERIAGQHWTIKGDQEGMVGLVNVDPASGKRLGSMKHVDPGIPITIDHVISLPKPENWIGMQAARGIALKMRPDWNKPAPTPTFETLTAACKAIWAERWKTDIEIDGPAEDQQAVRSFMFYLWGSIQPGAGMSVSPMGLSSTQYNGHVFWDADMWVAPALAFFFPDGAKAIVNYRVMDQWDSARKNFEDWKREGRPTGGKSLGPISSTEIASRFPWESSVSGKETVPGPSRFQDHISGSVAFGARTVLDIVGDRNFDWEAVEDVGAEVGDFYAARSEKGADGLQHLSGTMSPDEHHIGDNDLYTNLLAMWTRSGGKWSAKPTYYLPKDEKSFLTYDNDNLKGYKQAAAVLSIFPLQYPPAEKQAKVMMERFADKVTKNGPAMTDSVHATIWARLGEKDKAYKTWHESWQPFTNNPLMLFSEKRSSAKTYFTTGAAGSLNAVIYGFLGFRLDSEPESGAAWSKKLNGGSYLSIKPNLPPAWKSVKFKNFQLLGQPYTLTTTPETTRVEKGD